MKERTAEKAVITVRNFSRGMLKNFQAETLSFLRFLRVQREKFLVAQRYLLTALN